MRLTAPPMCAMGNAIPLLSSAVILQMLRHPYGTREQ